VGEVVRVGIDRGGQPVARTIDANHRLANRSLSRLDVAIGPWIGRARS
jgi:hypothetical protein